MRAKQHFHLFLLIVIFSIASSAFGRTEFLGKGNMQAMQFSPDGRWLAIGTTAILELYSAETYQPLRVIDTNVDALDFSPDGVEIAVGDNQSGSCLNRVQNRFLCDECRLTSTT